ncbi:PLP-dependent aminotransferase family protein [Bordetella genomosp. 5]|uniref:DNA-binding protein n=1 Tax=Bordetella genomosp. 5 TaxID=1395608 RepID=A0A261TWT1_9BORD|nr:PLP-dependent aminotransferase family protein [Bordetella genomosp. 5]OZI53751.1 DNA-binding protein [Bordetella genomosp. 5]
MSDSALAASALDLLDAPLDDPGAAGQPVSLQRQLQQRLRQAILSGRLAPGTRLPASRALAESLGISRNTVTIAYDHLAAEGYVLADRQGTRVAALARPAAASAPPPPVSALPALSARLAQIAPHPVRHDVHLALRPGTPALNHFPQAAWRGALERAVRGSGAAALGYGDPVGEPALRTAIARHLGIARGVRCDASQIVITEGAQEALALCVKLLSNPGDTAWVEEPGYRGAKTAFAAGDLRMVPIRVGAEGLAASAEDWRTRPPRLIYATPSHQYPTGAVLSAARRLELIALARSHGAWIIEDDYDSEFRHHGEPIAAMQGLVDAAPVLYVGTFSKTMFPSLRIGFLVLPRALAPAVAAPLGELLRGGHRHEQLALADFIESGQFSRHLGRMRRLYRERQTALRAALARHFDLPHQLEGGHCGLHLTLRLPPEYPDRAIVAAAAPHAIAPAALSAFALSPDARDNGLVLGYGNTSAERFDTIVTRLAQLARQAGRASG